MSRPIVDRTCASLPGAEWSDPGTGALDSWTVGGRIFACFSSVGEAGVSVKCADVETAALLIEMGRAVRAPYFHPSWVRLTWGLVPDDELAERLRTSYAIVRAGLPKKVQAALG